MLRTNVSQRHEMIECLLLHGEDITQFYHILLRIVYTINDINRLRTLLIVPGGLRLCTHLESYTVIEILHDIIRFDDLFIEYGAFRYCNINILGNIMDLGAIQCLQSFLNRNIVPRNIILDVCPLIDMTKYYSTVPTTVTQLLLAQEGTTEQGTVDDKDTMYEDSEDANPAHNQVLVVNDIILRYNECVNYLYAYLFNTPHHNPVHYLHTCITVYV